MTNGFLYEPKLTAVAKELYICPVSLQPPGADVLSRCYNVFDEEGVMVCSTHRKPFERREE